MFKQGDPDIRNDWFGSNLIKCTNLDNGYPADQELAQKHLMLNAVYSVKRVKVWPSYSEVELHEIPGILFNTVHFSGSK